MIRNTREKLLMRSLGVKGLTTLGIFCSVIAPRSKSHMREAQYLTSEYELCFCSLIENMQDLPLPQRKLETLKMSTLGIFNNRFTSLNWKLTICILYTTVI